jgi:hypothetical protein
MDLETKLSLKQIDVDKLMNKIDSTGKILQEKDN